MTQSISLATSSDTRAVTTLRTAVAHGMSEQFGEGDWSATPSEADVARTLSVSQVWVARSNTGIVGTVRLARVIPWAIDSSAFTPVASSLYVLGLAVVAEARGQGVGRQLMDAAKHAASLSTAEALWLDAYDHAAGAGPFYLKCGFRQVGRTLHRPMPLIYYEWLAPRRGAHA